MKWVVIDASAILRAVDEQNPKFETRFANLIKAVNHKKTQVLVPPLFWIECANALRYSKKSAQEAQALFKTIAQLPIYLTQTTQNTLAEAMKISDRLETTVYDAWYHVIALRLGATFITADAKYYRRAKKLGQIELWE